MFILSKLLRHAGWIGHDTEVGFHAFFGVQLLASYACLHCVARAVIGLSTLAVQSARNRRSTRTEMQTASSSGGGGGGGGGFLRVSRPAEGVLEVQLSRPEKANALTVASFAEFRRVFAPEQLEADGKETRVVLLTQAGRTFCAGIDLVGFFDHMSRELQPIACEARRRESFRRFILSLQEAFSALEACPVPVVACVHGPCVGGGVDLIAAADIRYCTKDASFAVKEVDLGITADLGSLQRLPRLIGESRTREMALTGRSVPADEALRAGLVAAVLESPEALREHGLKAARAIAAKSPLAVRGTKHVLNAQLASNLSVEGGLRYVAAYNAGALLASTDLEEAVSAALETRAPKFARARL
eukprot:tig00000123_g6919.t1